MGKKIGLNTDDKTIIFCPLNYNFATPISGMENSNFPIFIYKFEMLKKKKIEFIIYW